MEDLVLSCLESRVEENRNLYARFLVGPFLRGDALTVATALRRVLLSSVESIGVTALYIQGITHEFSTIVGVRESVLELSLNFGAIVLSYDKTFFQKKSFFDKLQIGYLQVQGPKVIYANHLKLPLGVKLVDPTQYIATVSKEGSIVLKFVIGKKNNFLHPNIGSESHFESQAKDLSTVGEISQKNIVSAKKTCSYKNGSAINSFREVKSYKPFTHKMEGLWFDKSSISKEPTAKRFVSYKSFCRRLCGSKICDSKALFSSASAKLRFASPSPGGRQATGFARGFASSSPKEREATRFSRSFALARTCKIVKSTSNSIAFFFGKPRQKKLTRTLLTFPDATNFSKNREEHGLYKYKSKVSFASGFAKQESVSMGPNCKSSVANALLASLPPRKPYKNGVTSAKFLANLLANAKLRFAKRFALALACSANKNDQVQNPVFNRCRKIFRKGTRDEVNPLTISFACLTNRRFVRGLCFASSGYAKLCNQATGCANLVCKGKAPLCFARGDKICIGKATCPFGQRVALARKQTCKKSCQAGFITQKADTKKDTIKQKKLEFLSNSNVFKSNTCFRNVIPLDLTLTPVLKVNFVVEIDDEVLYLRQKIRERIILEVWTNGSIHPRQAVHDCSLRLLDMFASFRSIYQVRSI